MTSDHIIHKISKSKQIRWAPLQATGPTLLVLNNCGRNSKDTALCRQRHMGPLPKSRAQSKPVCGGRRDSSLALRMPPLMCPPLGQGSQDQGTRFRWGGVELCFAKSMGFPLWRIFPPASRPRLDAFLIRARHTGGGRHGFLPFFIDRMFQYDSIVSKYVRKCFISIDL